MNERKKAVIVEMSGYGVGKEMRVYIKDKYGIEDFEIVDIAAKRPPGEFVNYSEMLKSAGEKVKKLTQDSGFAMVIILIPMVKGEHVTEDDIYANVYRLVRDAGDWELNVSAVVGLVVDSGKIYTV